MSVEERLRAGLRSQAYSWDPAVEGSLAAVRRRHVWRRVRIAGVSAVAAGAVIAGTVSGLQQDHVKGLPPAPLAGSSAPSLAGRYSATVVEPVRLAGDWTLTLRADGRVDVSPPAGYYGVVSAVLYQGTNTEFRTTLFQEDVCAGHGIGAYTWVRSHGFVSFTAIGESCAARRAFLVGNTWRST